MSGTLFDRFKDGFINIITSRITVLVIFFLTLGSILVYTVFDLQIVHGEEYLNNFQLTIRKERSIASTRGNIYDRNGNLLAYNVYESGKGKNAALNDTIYRLIGIIKKNGDSIVNDFNIILNTNNEFEFNITDSKLLRFIADVYGEKYVSDLKYAQQTATADEIISYLAGESRYAIGGYSEENPKEFVVGQGYSKKELL